MVHLFGIWLITCTHDRLTTRVLGVLSKAHCSSACHCKARGRRSEVILLGFVGTTRPAASEEEGHVPGGAGYSGTRAERVRELSEAVGALAENIHSINTALETLVARREWSHPAWF
jgi:hypothetical protein